MADITNYDTRINGVNQDTMFVREEAHLIDFEEHSEIMETGTHDLFMIPAGEAAIALRIVCIEDVASSGSATLKLHLKYGDDSASDVNSSAIAKANLASGFVHYLPVSGIKGYKSDVPCKVQATVGGAALTGGKIVVIADTIPILDFLTNG